MFTRSRDVKQWNKTFENEKKKKKKKKKLENLKKKILKLDLDTYRRITHSSHKVFCLFVFFILKSTL